MAEMDKKGEVRLRNALNELSNREVDDFAKQVIGLDKADPALKNVVLEEQAFREAVNQILQERDASKTK